MKRKRSDEFFDPITAWAVYLPGVGGFGSRCIGHIISRGETGFEALDAADKSLGVFPNTKSAADALSEAT